jgi:hypothetical protein
MIVANSTEGFNNDSIIVLSDHPLNNIHFTRTCMHCSKTWLIILSKEDYERWKIKREYVQTVFPSVSMEHREVAISGTCPPCFKDMFEGDE